MDRIIIRSTTLGRGYVNSAFINLCNGKIFSSEDEFLNEYGIQKIMKELYKEDIESSNLSDSSLYKSYYEVFQSGIDNDYFKIMYKIDDDFAVHLTENIYLYHLATTTGEIYSTIVPWVYADSRIFLGDTWWEEDITILQDLGSLSLIEFMRKYKGY